MLSPLENTQKDIESTSNYAESYISDCEVDVEELQMEPLFGKPRGERRWLGKHHHRGKEHLHNAVKDRTFIEKIIKSDAPLNEKAMNKIRESTSDNFEIGVVYSMDKKNRFKEATPVALLGSVPKNVNAEVVEKNALEKINLTYRNEDTFALHSKKANEDDFSEGFEVRTATASGRGQHYTNFLPTNRELSKKANARMMNIREEELVLDTTPCPIVSYNIYRPHRSKEVVGIQLNKSLVVSKSGRHRPTKNFDMEVYDDEEDYDDYEEPAEEVTSASCKTWNLTDCLVDNRKEKKYVRSELRNDSENSYDYLDYKNFNEEIEYAQLFNISEYLKNEGYVFIETDIVFSNQTENFLEQISNLREEKELKIKDLRPNQYLIDFSKWCQLDGAHKDGETTTVMVLTHLKNNLYKVILNSIVPTDPKKRNEEYLKKLISSASTIREAMTKVAGEISVNKKIIKTMTLSSKFYGDKTLSESINDNNDWGTTPLQMNWPNEHFHATWANSKELSQVGGQMEWKDLCEMVRKDNQMRTCYTSDEICGACNSRKKSCELFVVKTEEKVKCTDCLRTEFYREFGAKRLPIDLQTDTADELEYLPTIIPLTVLNLYIRMVSEMIYEDLGATGSFEKCPSCKSAVFFEETPGKSSNKMQNRSCPCGYSWCGKCKNVPHWPMNCEDFSEWEKKWMLRYSIAHAQGEGKETLLQITCACNKAIYDVLLPAHIIKCPSCHLHININSMHVAHHHQYYPFSPRYRESLRRCYADQERNDAYPFEPQREISIPISKIPAIKASVLEVCTKSRDVRFDSTLRNRMVHRENVLIRNNVLKMPEVENLLGTTVYLVENVTAWMQMTNNYDKDIRITLENIMDTRETYVELMTKEDGDAIRQCIGKLRIQIDSVVSTVQKKLNSN